ncbi:unnamed protein product [Soboliphyme baturini]|uniref:UAE_UbL domain-containing protein n=1 Tax=Soboliphyme baturini TaxID=241478 RepID=A0A183IVK0_9BILA|nr:unnamed protein product [Soboliphyme baturini]
MIAPDVHRFDNFGSIIISSDPEEAIATHDKTFAELSIRDGDNLQCDDFMQNFKFKLIVHHNRNLSSEDYEMLASVGSPAPEEENMEGGASRFLPLSFRTGCNSIPDCSLLRRFVNIRQPLSFCSASGCQKSMSKF